MDLVAFGIAHRPSPHLQEVTVIGGFVRVFPREPGGRPSSSTNSKRSKDRATVGNGDEAAGLVTGFRFVAAPGGRSWSSRLPRDSTRGTAANIAAPTEVGRGRIAPLRHRGVFGKASASEAVFSRTEVNRGRMSLTVDAHLILATGWRRLPRLVQTRIWYGVGLKYLVGDISRSTSK